MAYVTIPGAGNTQINVSVDGAENQALIDNYKSVLISSGMPHTLLATGFSTLPGGQGEITSSGTYSIGGASSASVVIGESVPSGSTSSSVLDTNVNVTLALTSSATVISGNAGNTTINTGSVSSVTVVGAAGNNVITASNNSSALIQTGNGNDTIFTGIGASTVDAGTGDNSITLGTGANFVRSEGQDTITGFGQHDVVTIIGGSSQVSLGSTALVIDAASASTVTLGENSTLAGGTGDTVTFTGSTGSVLGGMSDTISAAGNLNITDANNSTINVSGTLNFIGGSGDTTITAGNATVYGAAGLNAVVSATSGHVLFASMGGSETVNGASSTTALHAFGNSGYTVFIGGSAADTLVGGALGNVMTGGSGSANLFAFVDGTNGGSSVVTDFGSAAGNQIALYDYGYQNNNGLQTLLDSATVAGGNTTLKLSDNSTITFLNVTDLNSGDFQLS